MCACIHFTQIHTWRSQVLWCPLWYLAISLSNRRWMSWNITVFLPVCSVKLHPPHMSAAQLDRAMEQRWTEHHFSVEFNCSFALHTVMYDWTSTHHTPHYDLNIIAPDGFNAPLFSPLQRNRSDDKVIRSSEMENDKCVSSPAQVQCGFMSWKNESGAVLLVFKRHFQDKWSSKCEVLLVIRTYFYILILDLYVLSSSFVKHFTCHITWSLINPFLRYGCCRVCKLFVMAEYFMNH